VPGAGGARRLGAVRGGMGRSKWTAWAQSAVDVHYHPNAASTGSGVLRPSWMCPSQRPGRRTRWWAEWCTSQAGGCFWPWWGRGGGVLAGLVTGYNAGRLAWSAKYDDETSQGPEELEAADMGLYGPGVDAGDAGGERGPPRSVKGVPTTSECMGAGRVAAWYLSAWPAGAGQVARARANQRRTGGLVWQGG
jgi:hypothetical protein